MYEIYIKTGESIDAVEADAVVRELQRIGIKAVMLFKEE